MMRKLIMRSRALFEKTVLAAPPVASATRRRAIALTGAGLGAALVGGCQGRRSGAIDISGNSPALEFAMTRASDGRRVTQADYRGRIVMLYFGYTFCPDVCPTTLANVADDSQAAGSGR